MGAYEDLLNNLVTQDGSIDPAQEVDAYMKSRRAAWKLSLANMGIHDDKTAARLVKWFDEDDLPTDPEGGSEGNPYRGTKRSTSPRTADQRNERHEMYLLFMLMAALLAMAVVILTTT